MKNINVESIMYSNLSDIEKNDFITVFSNINYNDRNNLISNISNLLNTKFEKISPYDTLLI